MNTLYLTLRYLAAHRGGTLLLALALGLTFAIPLGTRALVDGLERRLRARSAATPLVIGARGSRFDLVLDALYFRRTGLEPIHAGVLDELSARDDALVVPLDVRHSARGAPLVGTSLDYFERRGLALDSGQLPLLLGECALGAALAERLGLGPGERLFTDPVDLYDITRPPAIELAISGVLARAGTPDDDAVFCDVRTGWVVDGLYHGHEAITDDVDPSLVLGRDERRVTLNAAFLSLAEVAPERLAEFHLHAEREDLPLSALLVFPESAKAATLLATRVNASSGERAVRPADVIEELLGIVLRLRRTLDAVAAVLGAATLLLAGLVLALANARRAGELKSYELLGASRAKVRALGLAPAVTVLLSALAAALCATLLLRWFGPDPTRFL